MLKLRLSVVVDGYENEKQLPMMVFGVEQLAPPGFFFYNYSIGKINQIILLSGIL